MLSCPCIRELGRVIPVADIARLAFAYVHEQPGDEFTYWCGYSATAIDGMSPSLHLADEYTPVTFGMIVGCGVGAMIRITSDGPNIVVDITCIAWTRGRTRTYTINPIIPFNHYGRRDIITVLESLDIARIDCVGRAIAFLHDHNRR